MMKMPLLPMEWVILMTQGCTVRIWQQGCHLLDHHVNGIFACQMVMHIKMIDVIVNSFDGQICVDGLGIGDHIDIRRFLKAWYGVFPMLHQTHQKCAVL